MASLQLAQQQLPQQAAPANMEHMRLVGKKWSNMHHRYVISRVLACLAAHAPLGYAAC
jgi:hypothetical protein